MSAKAAQAWAALNERQRLYLSTILRFDQAVEADIKARSARWESTPPAAEWRQITYDIDLPKEIIGYSSVQAELREQGRHDTGSGSTLAALSRRGLVTVTHDQVLVPPLGMVDRIRVRLTTAGRAAARAGADVATAPSTPAGLMARWSLVALARLYEAGESGLCAESTHDRADAAPSWNTLLRLRGRRDGSLIEEFHTDHPSPTRRGFRQYRVRLSAAGRRHFEIHRACYRQLYPDLDLPEAELVDEAHAGLDDHRGRRPRGLVRDVDLRVLAKLAAVEATGHCYLRQAMIEDYDHYDELVPDAVRAIPPGLLRSQVKEIARSEKSLDRLIAHSDGALVEVVAVPNLRRHRATRPTLDLIVLTQHGRDHLAAHLADYRRAYPDLVLLPDGVRP